MSWWVVATAMAGAATLGPYVAERPAQYTPLTQEWSSPEWSEVEQAVRLAKVGGTHIGVTLRDLNEDDQKGGKVGNGVMIESVETDSPAAKAGLKANDIVVEFDGERVRSSRQLARLVQETVPGRSVPLVATRDGQRVTLTVQPRDSSTSFRLVDRLDGSLTRVMPAPMPVPKGSTFPFTFFATGQLGLAVSELSPQLGEYFGTKDGVLVTSVTENSLASKVGVKAGDVITSLDGGSINDSAELRRRTQRLEPGDEFTLGIVRDKKPMTLKGKVESPRRPIGRTIL